MLEFMKETESVWERLAAEKRPLLLYGMGDGADKILAALEKVGKRPAGIFASDEFVRGQEYAGFRVQTLAALKKQFPEFVIVLAFASERPEMLARFAQLAAAYPLLAPHVPLFAGEESVSPGWLQKYEPQLTQVYDLLADDASRQVMAGALNYKLSGKIEYLQAITTQREADLQQLFRQPELDQTDPGQNAPWTYVDGGAYTGDTVREFLQLTGGKYKKIWACEPDPKNYRKLTAWVKQQGLTHISCVPKGLWSAPGVRKFSGTSGRQAALLTEGQPEPKKIISVPVTSLDVLLGEARADYIKLDVEGAEKETLAGAAGQLAGQPRIMCAAYHHDRDLFELPLALWQAHPAYRVYLRKHPYVPDWELNFFAF